METDRIQKVLVQKEDGTRAVMTLEPYKISGEFMYYNIIKIEPVTDINALLLKEINVPVRPLWLTREIETDAAFIWNSHIEGTEDHKRVDAVEYLRKEAVKKGFLKPDLKETMEIMQNIIYKLYT